MSKCTPSDPVDKLLGVTNPAEDLSSMDAYYKKYQEIVYKLGLDKPEFYFAIVPRGYPDTLWSITNSQEKKLWTYLLYNYGDFEYISKYIKSLDDFIHPFTDSLVQTNAQNKIKGVSLVKKLKNGYNEKIILQTYSELKESFPFLLTYPSFLNLQTCFSEMRSNRSRLNITPRFKWFGLDNQYHQWISQMMSANFGLSIRDGRPVGTKIGEALKWTLSINGLAIILAMVVSILLGVYLAGYASTKMDHLISSLTYVIYAIPLFWLATLLVIFFTTEEYGLWTDIFQGIGVVQIYEGGSFGQRFMASTGRLILPILCFVLSLMTYLTRQMRSSLKAELDKPYFLQLKANGYSKHIRIWKHALPNALFPMITLLSILIPISVAGSLIIEYIFNIPGMGKLLMDSILYQDWNVVFSIVILIATITMLSLLMADLLYAWLDPRVRLKHQKY